MERGRVCMDIITDDDMIREIGGSRNKRDWTSAEWACACVVEIRISRGGDFRGDFSMGPRARKKSFDFEVSLPI